MKNNLRKSIRVHKRRSTPVDHFGEPESAKVLGPEAGLDKVIFE
jgi:hypothetical protein